MTHFDATDTIQIALARRQSHEAFIAEKQLVATLPPQERPASSQRLLLLLVALVTIAFASFFFARDVIAAEPVPVPEMIIDPGMVKTGDLVGIYRIYDGAYPSHIEFQADGQFRRAVSTRNLASEPLDYGIWALFDDELTLTSAAAITNCGTGRVGTYHLAHYDRGGYYFERLVEECEARMGFVPTATVQPLQPAGLLCRTDADVLCSR